MRPALVVTPLAKERDALVAAFEAVGCACRTETGDRIDRVAVPDLDVVLAAAGHGKAQFAAGAQHLVERTAPAALVVAGAAGALDPKLRPGDVVLATESVEHDYKLRFHGVAPPPRHPASGDLARAIVAAQPAHAFALHRGPVAGGDEDVVDAERAADLRARTGALCVAWEGPAGARVAAFNGVPFAELRTVTDAADADAATSYRTHLADAMRNVGGVLVAWRRAGS